MSRPQPPVHIIDPEIADLMGRAFDAAWAQLSSFGSVYAQPYKADETREMIALKMIEVASQGERDFARLVQRVLGELGFSSEESHRAAAQTSAGSPLMAS